MASDDAVGCRAATARSTGLVIRRRAGYTGWLEVCDLRHCVAAWTGHGVLLDLSHLRRPYEAL